MPLKVASIFLFVVGYQYQVHLPNMHLHAFMIMFMFTTLWLEQKNRTGKTYRGHYDIELTNQLQVLLSDTTV